jgi:hypothetical protein
LKDLKWSIGQTFGPDRLEALLQVADFRFRQRQPVFERPVGIAHLAGRFHQRFDHRLDLVAVAGDGELFGCAG